VPFSAFICVPGVFARHVGLIALSIGLAAAAADMAKVVRVAYPSAENKLDPQAESDEASGGIADNIFDSLLEYDYLARPAKLKPRAAAGLPEITAGGRVYTIHVKPGIRFTPDAAFHGKARELVASDFVYSIERLLDPRMKSQWLFLVDGKIVGADTAVAEARRTNRFDYDRPIEGLRALDRYTLRITLTAPDYNFGYVLAMNATAAVAREVVEAYGDEVARHPVGTGPYRLVQWTPGARLVLEANPGYRQETFESAGADDARSREIAAGLAGKRLPLVGRIEVSIIDEEQPRWLAFLGGEHEYLRPLPEQFGDVGMPGGELAPNLAKKGIRATPDEIAYVTYTTFNMLPEVDGRPNPVGGYSPERVALRRAIALGFRIEDQVAILDKHQSVRAGSPLPPSVVGADPRFHGAPSDPARAKALLDLFGYVDRDHDGYRENPDGSPLSFDHASVPTQRERPRNELWKRSMDDIGIRVTFHKVEKLPELRTQAQLGKVQSFSYGWIADYPDGEDFLQLFWGGSLGQANYAMFDLPEYNALYEKAKRLPPGAERDALYTRMVKLVLAYVPWVVETYKAQTVLMQPWLLHYKKHPFMIEPWKYLDIDLARERRERR
jgi:oligopeptide transport system substrate-binding protein